jgi:hypothetical protein
MTSSQHGPYAQGYTRGTMAGTMGREAARWSKPLKPGLSPDWRLQFASMKLESLVTAHQPWRGEYVLGSCTHRPSRQASWELLKASDSGTKESLMRGTKS